MLIDNIGMESPVTCKITGPGSVHGRDVRAARILLEWTKARAAQECGVGVNTLGRFEEGSSKLAPRTVTDIVRTFQAAGIVFLECESGTGVLFNRTSRNK